MISFTQNRENKINEFINAFLKSIVDKILLELPPYYVKAIVLVGGFGRGEGGAYEENGAIRLVNDLDLMVIPQPYKLFDNKINIKRKLKDISNYFIKENTGLKQIDINLTSIFSLLISPNTIANYEIKMGHVVLYGKINFNSLLKFKSETKLDLYEGANLFYNRGAGLLIALLTIIDNKINDEKLNKNFWIEIQKGCQAIGDSYLLLFNKYHYSYKKRLENFLQLISEKRDAFNFENIEEFSQLYEWGITRKLKPEFNEFSSETMIKKWFNVVGIYGKYFLNYENIRYDMKISNWIEYSNLILYKGLNYSTSMQIKYFLKSVKNIFNNEKQLEKINMFAAMPLLLFSVNDKMNVEKELFSKACQLLNYEYVDYNIEEWSNVVKKFLVLYHPDGIVQYLVGINEKN